MWIFAKKGFLSIVKHRDKPRMLLVRSRFQGDIEALFPDAVVEETPLADYRYRATISAANVAATLAWEAREINYEAFKNAVERDRVALYSEVWATMRVAQDEGSVRLFPKYELEPGGCWTWTAAISSAGYGVVQWEGRVQLAHRVLYELVHGPIPDGLDLDHLCRNRICVNPAHLEAVTQRTNILRSKGPSAENARKTHCIRGHEFTPENTYHVQGKRQCRTCVRKAAREGYHRRKKPAGTDQ